MGNRDDKTQSSFIDGLHGRHGGSEESEGKPQGETGSSAGEAPTEGNHRLFEDRQQHDEAEKNSGSNRLRR